MSPATSSDKSPSASLLVVRALSSDPQRVEPHLDRLGELTGADRFRLRDVFTNGSMGILVRSSVGASLEKTQARLREAGYGAVLLNETELKAMPNPVRIPRIMVSGGTYRFLDVHGAEHFTTAGDGQALIVIGNLGEEAQKRAIARMLVRSRSAEQQPENSFVRCLRGRAVVDIHPLRGESVRIYTRRLTFRGVTGAERFSVIRNLAGCLGSLRKRSGVHVDTAFGSISLPGFSISGSGLRHGFNARESAAREREEAFNRYSAIAASAWRRGLFTGTPPPAPPAGTPADRKAQLAAELDPSSRCETELKPPPIGYICRSGGFVVAPGQVGGRLMNVLQQYGNPALLGPLLLAAAGCFLAGQFVARSDWLFLGLFLLGGGLITSGLTALARRRRIQNYPTARVRSMAMGPVELAGTARPRYFVQAPYLNLQVVYYSYAYQRWVQQGNKSGYRTVRTGGTRNLPFYLEDETGTVLVDPTGAIIDTHRRETIHTDGLGFSSTSPLVSMHSSMSGPGSHPDRVIIHYIPVGYPLYILGVAARVGDHYQEQEQRYRERLRNLKQNPARITQYDADGDGTIDVEEWEAARAAVRREMLEETSVAGRQEQVVLTGGARRDLFYLSDRSEKKVLDKLLWRMLIGLGGGGVAVVYGLHRVLPLLRAWLL